MSEHMVGRVALWFYLIGAVVTVLWEQLSY